MAQSLFNTLDFSKFEGIKSEFTPTILGGFIFLFKTSFYGSRKYIR